MTRLGIEPRSPGPLANTLPTRPTYIYIYISPKIQKMVLDASLLNTQHYKVWIKSIRVKWSNPGKGVEPSRTSHCSSYWKGSLRLALNYSSQLYLLYIYIYIHKSFIQYQCSTVQNNYLICSNLIRTPTFFLKIYIYIYIYIYVVIHRQTVSFYQNSSVWLDMQDARSRDRNPSHFTLD